MAERDRHAEHRKWLREKGSPSQKAWVKQVEADEARERAEQAALARGRRKA